MWKISSANYAEREPFAAITICIASLCILDVYTQAQTSLLRQLPIILSDNLVEMKEILWLVIGHLEFVGEFTLIDCIPVSI